MTISHANRIHPTAIIDPLAQLAEDVIVGPYSIISGPVQIGPGCVIGPHVQLIGRLVLGPGNILHAGVVLGDAPQHLHDSGSDTCTLIGAGNVFREHVTVHRGSARTGQTIIGDRNYFMVNSHVAHDCRIGNDCQLANGALLAGHVALGDRVLISGNTAIHQFVRLGRLSLLSGLSSLTMDLPPFMVAAERNNVVGVNIIGMRRAGLTTATISAVRRAYRVLFQSQLPQSQAVAQLAELAASVAEVAEILEFIRHSSRGICPAQANRRSHAAANAAADSSAASNADSSVPPSEAA
jgi:UDP-N-acetylglucosamine acyltransferase